MVVIYFFILGLIFGSFLNVLVDRGQRGEKITGRSKCDFCAYQLKWFDNLPVASFLVLGGKCRKCAKKLSWQYPAVELATGLLFVAAAWRSGVFGGKISGEIIVDASLLSILSFILFAVFLWDLKSMVIPDRLVIGGTAVTLAFLLFQQLTGPTSQFFHGSVWSHVLAGFLVSGFFWLQFWISKGRWIGGGDVKLGFLLGLAVGLKQIYLLLLLSYILGALVSVVLIAKNKKKMQSKVPFGPFLVAGTLATLFFGEKLLQWYWGMI